VTRSAVSTPQQFKTVFRRWRQHRKLSQLELALAAGVSQRHVSWLETGRSQPSREMVIRLSEAMEIPLRERNVLLQSAGYSALYAEKRLDEPGMEPVLEALRHLLEHHEPYPAVAVDRFWNVKMQNTAAGLLFGLGGDPEAMRGRMGESGEPNLALLSLHPEGLRPYIVNWAQVVPSFIRRLRSEALASGDALMQERFERYIALAGPIGEVGWIHESLMPVLPLELRINGLELSLFTIITTLGTPQDVTADELRVEAFFPANPATEQFFRGVSATTR
jgi:transcriptional regulator with XRE-family HTH domain